jgi:hypothetical protein
MHLRRIDPAEFSASVEALKIVAGETTARNVIRNGNYGLTDYLREARVGYSYFSVRTGSEDNFSVRRYRDLFSAQRQSRLADYVESLARDELACGVAIAPCVQAAAQFAMILTKGKSSNDQKRTGKGSNERKTAWSEIASK